MKKFIKEHLIQTWIAAKYCICYFDSYSIRYRCAM